MIDFYRKINTLIRNLFGLFRYKTHIFRNSILKESDEIQTHLTPPEKAKLHDLAKTVKNGFAVEIGSFIGASSCFIAAGIDCNSKIICIDTWQNDAMSEGKRDTYNEFISNTKSYQNKIIMIKDYSSNAINKIKDFANEIDLLFIDGDHTYEGCKKDWDLYFKLVRRGGIVVFHDTGWAEGVIKVIKEDAYFNLVRCKQLPNMFWGYKK